MKGKEYSGFEKSESRFKTESEIILRKEKPEKLLFEYFFCVKVTEHTKGLSREDIEKYLSNNLQFLIYLGIEEEVFWELLNKNYKPESELFAKFEELK